MPICFEVNNAEDPKLINCVQTSLPKPYSIWLKERCFLPAQSIHPSNGTTKSGTACTHYYSVYRYLDSNKYQYIKQTCMHIIIMPRLELWSWLVTQRDNFKWSVKDSRNSISTPIEIYSLHRPNTRGPTHGNFWHMQSAYMGIINHPCRV